MKKIYILFFITLLCFVTPEIQAQEAGKISGKVLSTLNLPVEGAVISVTGSEDVKTDANGTFTIACKNPEKATISIWAAGYYRVLQAVNNRSEVTIIMIPESQYKYNESKVLPFRIENNTATTSAENITKKDFMPASMKIDRALSGQIAGLQVIRGSGMPGEGSYINLRGIRSFVGNNTPLVVINGIPYMPDTHDSQLINGLGRDIFQAYNINDIQNITVLKGAEAAIYGSMGANGVILIETDGATAENLNTEISYHGQFGINWNDKRMPLLSGTTYKSFLSDIGMNRYNDMETLFARFPFLNTTATNLYQRYYNNAATTDWQDEIYQKGIATDHLFRVEGGDAVAKYDISLGYSKEEGILKNTDKQRYHTQMNGNFTINKNLEVYTTVGLSYMTGNYREQGMNVRTNPILAAYAQSPALYPFQRIQQPDGSIDNTPLYSEYYFGAPALWKQDGNGEDFPDAMDAAVSNPLALVNTLDASNRQYDVNIKAGFNYKLLRDLTLNGAFGIYYNYNSEHVFIPGITDKSIIPLTDFYGKEENTIREGVGKNTNYFYNLNARYNTKFNNRDALNAMIGFQALTTQYEYDGAYARNTTNDFYQVLGATQSNDPATKFSGYLDKWNWMNFYGHVDYTFNNILNASLNMSVDGSSATGKYTNRFRIYPSGGLTWMVKNMPFLINQTWINQLNLRAEYSVTGNSRFSSNYGKSYYESAPFLKVSGIVRKQIPNQHLKPEITNQVNLSLEGAFLRNRIHLGVNYYNGKSKDVIINMPKSSVYGTSSYYANCAKINNSGIELSAQASLIRLREFEWIVGGNISFIKSKIKSLGENEQIVTEYSDGSQLVSRIDGNPYEFYGLQAAGVFSTQAEANEANLVNSSSQRYNAGDVHYIDQNEDGRIDYKDYVSLGSATPDYFGGFYTHIRYKHFSLSAEFSYTKGNEAYNAVRRSLESVSSFANQSEAVTSRWNLEGQKTDMPRATFGDAIGNNDFSSRWIEDASYLRMKNVTLSYNFNKPIWNFFRSGTIYITGENLLTATKYLGMDPEFAYSVGNPTIQGYDCAKVMQPKSVKLGVNLKF